MIDIARIRVELKTLIKRLSNQYVPWKQEKDRKEKEERRARRLARKSSHKGNGAAPQFNEVAEVTLSLGPDAANEYTTRETGVAYSDSEQAVSIFADMPDTNIRLSSSFDVENNDDLPWDSDDNENLAATIDAEQFSLKEVDGRNDNVDLHNPDDSDAAKTTNDATTETATIWKDNSSSCDNEAEEDCDASLCLTPSRCSSHQATRATFKSNKLKERNESQLSDSEKVKVSVKRVAEIKQQKKESNVKIQQDTTTAPVRKREESEYVALDVDVKGSSVHNQQKKIRTGKPRTAGAPRSAATAKQADEISKHPERMPSPETSGGAKLAKHNRESKLVGDEPDLVEQHRAERSNGARKSFSTETRSRGADSLNVREKEVRAALTDGTKPTGAHLSRTGSGSVDTAKDRQLKTKRRVEKPGEILERACKCTVSSEESDNSAQYEVADEESLSCGTQLADEEENESESEVSNLFENETDFLDTQRQATVPLDATAKKVIESQAAPPMSLPTSPFAPMDLPPRPPTRKNVNSRYTVDGDTFSNPQQTPKSQNTTERRFLGKSARVLSREDTANIPKTAPPLRKLPKPQGIMKKTSRFGTKPLNAHQTTTEAAAMSHPTTTPKTEECGWTKSSMSSSFPVQSLPEPQNLQLRAAAASAAAQQQIFRKDEVHEAETTLQQQNNDSVGAAKGQRSSSDEKLAETARPSILSIPSLDDNQHHADNVKTHVAAAATMPSSENDDSSSFSDRVNDLDETPWDSDNDDAKPAASGSKRRFEETGGCDVIDLFNVDDSDDDDDDESRTEDQSSAKNCFGSQTAFGATRETAISLDSSSSSSDSEEEKKDDYEIKDYAASLPSASHSQTAAEETLEMKEQRERNETINAILRKRRAVNPPKQRHGTPPRSTQQKETQQAYSPNRTVNLKEQRRKIMMSKQGASALTSPARPRSRRNYASHTVSLITTPILPPQKPKLRIVPKVGRSARAMQGNRTSTAVASPEKPSFPRPPMHTGAKGDSSGVSGKIGRSTITASNAIAGTRTNSLNQLMGGKTAPDEIPGQVAQLVARTTQPSIFDKRIKSASAYQADEISKQPERTLPHKASGAELVEQNRESKSVGEEPDLVEQHLRQRGDEGAQEALVTEMYSKGTDSAKEREAGEIAMTTDDTLESTSTPLSRKESGSEGTAKDEQVKTVESGEEKSVDITSAASILVSEESERVDEFVVSSEESDKSAQYDVAADEESLDRGSTQFADEEENESELEVSNLFEDGTDSLDTQRQATVPLDATAKAAIENKAADIDLPAWMIRVDHLSTKTIGKDGLPTWTFTVHSGDDGTLYEFKAYIAKSKIPGRWSWRLS